MRLNDLDAWVIARVVADMPVNGEMQAVSAMFQTIAAHLLTLPAEARQFALDGFLLYPGIDRDAAYLAIDSTDPSGPPPEVAGKLTRPANLADLRRMMSGSQWVWEGWIPASRISGIAAFEGVGKTRLAMDLARRIWFALPWPDGQPPSFPANTPTLWICSDGQQDDLAGIATACGLPDESICFNAMPDDPYGGNDLDDSGCLARLEEFIVQVRPGLVFVDSLTYATDKDLCQANQVQALMTPLRDIAQRTQTTIFPLLHVAKDGQALGRRIKGITRTILQLECPDPNRSNRLRLSVSKSFAVKPPALGVTMDDMGNHYDSNPPNQAEPGRVGRPPGEREKAERFLRETLTRQNDRIGNELAKEWESTGGSGKTFWRAAKDMEGTGDLISDGGSGTQKQKMLHLNSAHPEPDEPT
ncbi:AAA family ATPase [Tundrisphaera lichenicola]|uniref:AAA family ATPase n=1 Tax=Tundrisphaera lichenicola TaxID=2029860 RepID=UPI003EC0D9C3